MKKMKLIVTVILIVAFAAMGAFIANGAGAVYKLGDTMDDFSVTTYDGRTLTLSELLEEKDMVLLHFWTTWCDYCTLEFPHIEKAYQQYGDDIEIIAVTCEPADTDDVLAEYAAASGISFPLTGDYEMLAEAFGVNSYPRSIVIDRNGVICFIANGAILEENVFENIFGYYTDDAYDEPRLLNGIPSAKPDIDTSSPEELAAALGGEGPEIEFYNDDFAYSWPMNVVSIDNRDAVASTNSAAYGSSAYLFAGFEASEGDAAVITFKTSAEPAFNLMNISLNGDHIRSFTGANDWMSYAIPITESGSQELQISFNNNVQQSSYENTIWIDSISVLTGDAATEALSENPEYPVSEMTRIVPVGDNVARIYLDDPSDPEGTINEMYDFYIVNSTEPDFLIEVSEDHIPESLLVVTNYDNTTWSVSDNLTDEGYMITGKIDSLTTTGYSTTAITLFEMPASTELDARIYVFADEENLNAFVMDISGGMATWHYADGSAQMGASVAAVSEVKYTLKAADQDGNLVPGTMIQVCSDSTCMVYTTGFDGTVSFYLPGYEYELHLLKAPDGYTADGESTMLTEADGGEYVIELIKN